MPHKFVGRQTATRPVAREPAISPAHAPPARAVLNAMVEVGGVCKGLKADAVEAKALDRTGDGGDGSSKRAVERPLAELEHLFEYLCVRREATPLYTHLHDPSPSNFLFHLAAYVITLDHLFSPPNLIFSTLGEAATALYQPCGI